MRPPSLFPLLFLILGHFLLPTFSTPVRLDAAPVQIQQYKRYCRYWACRNGIEPGWMQTLSPMPSLNPAATPSATVALSDNYAHGASEQYYSRGRAWIGHTARSGLESRFLLEQRQRWRGSFFPWHPVLYGFGWCDCYLPNVLNGDPPLDYLACVLHSILRHPTCFHIVLVECTTGVT
ncbi:hypothetical protein BJY52DRAFT_384469 [Lactarius psammicola]|nr:hypothetical protein BJY52DRAFT_384469 [Lactarius psammicola]